MSGVRSDLHHASTNDHKEDLDHGITPRGNQSHRLHRRAVRTGVFAVNGVVGRRRPESRAHAHRRQHPNPVARHPERGRAVLHHGQQQQAVARDRHQDARRQGDPGGPDPPLRRDGRKHGAGRARPPGLHLGAYPRTQPAPDLRRSEGLPRRLALHRSQVVRHRGPVRRQERLERVGVLEEYPQYPIREDGKYGTFTDAVPRGGNAGGGGQPGWVLKCKGWETDPNSYIYFTIQGSNWVKTAEAIGHPEWAKDPNYATANARQPHIFDIFAEIEKFLADKTKYEAVEYFSKFDVPCSPVLSMKEIKHDEFLQKIGTVVEVPHKTRGSYWTVGCPMKFSSFTPKITSAPLLGEHTDEVLRELGYSEHQIVKLHEKKAVGSTGIESKPKSESKKEEVLF